MVRKAQVVFAHILKVLVLPLALLPILGCKSTIAWVSSEKATWDFIQKNCGGMTLGAPEISDSRVAIPVYVVDRLDSALCVFSAKGRVSGNQIEVSVRKGLCPGEVTHPLQVKVTRPKIGDYQIVYSDARAGYPVLGSLHIE